MSVESTENPFLDESFLIKLEQLRIIARQRIRGGQTGEHISWKHGENLEFHDYRNYHPGDDFRYVDWNVYGRLNRLFIKLFQSEKDFAIHILIDTSLSMGFGDPSKDIQSKKIAAALAYIGLANHDRVGISAFNQEITLSRVPEKGRQVYHSVLDFLQHIRPESLTSLSRSLNDFIATRTQSGLVIIISDLLDPKGLRNSLKSVNLKKFDPIVIQVLDKSEIRPDMKGYIKLRDVETGGSRKMMVNQATAAKYTQKMEVYLNKIRSICSETNVEYFMTESHVPFEDFLLNFLIKGRFLR